MTREEARKAAEVMLAYANGEKIEYCEYGDNEYCDCDDTCFYWSIGDYRVQLKPKSKTKFDPKTLQQFDKVVVRDENGLWKCGLFSHIDEELDSYKYVCIGSTYCYCIPYNDETKYLVGTEKEAPEYYRYWEEQVVGIEEEKTEKHPNNIWYDANEEPKEYPIICQDELSNVWIQYSLKDYVDGWKEFEECECIIRWAYVKDILPKYVRSSK